MAWVPRAAEANRRSSVWFEAKNELRTRTYILNERMYVTLCYTNLKCCLLKMLLLIFLIVWPNIIVKSGLRNKNDLFPPSLSKKLSQKVPSKFFPNMFIFSNIIFKPILLWRVSFKLETKTEGTTDWLMKLISRFAWEKV